MKTLSAIFLIGAMLIGDLSNASSPTIRDEEVVFLMITSFPTTLTALTIQSLEKAFRKKEEVKAAQVDAIAYMQDTEAGHEGVLTPSLQRGLEIVSELPEMTEHSEKEIIYAIALAQFDSAEEK